MDGIISVEENLGEVLSPDKLDEMIQCVTGWALLNGVQKKITGSEFPEQMEAMPFTMYPSIFPATVLQKTQRLHTIFQSVVYKIANDHEFLENCLSGLLEADDFTREFWNIYQTVRKEGISQPVSVTLTRNDFMMEYNDDGGQDCKQVEFNTFASGAGGVISAMTEVHKYSLSLAGISFKPEQLPDNYPTKGLAKGLVKAMEHYPNKSASILFVVGVPEPNTPDQRWLERDILQLNPSQRVIYKTFQQLLEQMKLDDNKILTVDGIEIGLVYYRYGYSPKHYPTEKEFQLRLNLERSHAIKCPTMAFHLAGCKKIQQVLAEPGILERFLPQSEYLDEIKSTFVGLYKLDSSESNTIISTALNNPEKFVLKPQREGGGNNLFGDELKSFLEKIKDTPEASSWILMDRIRAARHRNRLIRVGLGPELRDVVSELGIFGVHLSTKSEEIENFECGYLLRTKPEIANEGGLFSGHSCLDSPYLVV
ncbi:hypothetical protein ACF0H5_021144 [Mactra antiquata]